MAGDVAWMEAIAPPLFAIQNQVQASRKAEVRHALGGRGISLRLRSRALFRVVEIVQKVRMFFS